MAEETQDDPPLSPSQRSKIRRLSEPKEPGPGEEAGELALVPYLDIIMNVLMFVLAGVAVTFTSTIDTTPPSLGGGRVRQNIDTRSLNLSAWITDKGISLKTSSGNIAPGCNDTGPDITLPMRDGKHDLTGVTECAKKLKRARPEFGDETQVTITANPGTPYGTVIDVMDALRHAGDDELFPDVHFGVAR